MDASVPKLMADNYAREQDAKREIRIRTALNKILDDIRMSAITRQILFGPEGLHNEAEIEEVRERLKALHYSVIVESDMGMSYELVTW